LRQETNKQKPMQAQVACTDRKESKVMKRSTINQIIHHLKMGSKPALLAVAILSVGAALSMQAANPGVLPAIVSYGKSYAEWSAEH
jgi:hypothetical protein